MDLETAINQTYDIIAKITNPASFSYMAEFPGLDKLGFSESEYTSDTAKNVGYVIISALSAGEYWADYGEHTQPYGIIQTMLHYDIVSLGDIEQALWVYRRSNDPPIGDIV